MAFPFAGQSFIVKPLYGLQTKRPRDSGNVFPFLVTLQNLNWDGAGKLFVNATVFFDFPYAALFLYQLWYVTQVKFRMGITNSVYLPRCDAERNHVPSRG